MYIKSCGSNYVGCRCEANVQPYVASLASPELVLGFYPADFLNEFAGKMGATFNVTVASSLDNISGVVNPQDGEWEPLDTSLAVGSLPPFTSDPTVLSYKSLESNANDYTVVVLLNELSCLWDVSRRAREVHT